MRVLLTLMIMILFTVVKAQTVFPGFSGDMYTNSLYHNKHLYDSGAQKKWFVSRYIGITAGYSFFKGGSAGIVSAPLNLQLNRRINNNLYAFAGVSAAPSYINFNNTFLNTDVNTTNTGNSFFKNRSIGAYSSASLGLMYINDARTFSISGSIGIEKNNYPVYYYNPVNVTRSTNSLPAYR